MAGVDRVGWLQLRLWTAQGSVRTLSHASGAVRLAGVQLLGVRLTAHKHGLKHHVGWRTDLQVHCCRDTVAVCCRCGGGQWHQCGDIVYSEGPSRWAASSHCFTAVFVQTGALKHGFPMHNCLPSDVQAHRHRRNRWWQAGASHAEMFCESLTTFCSDLSRG